MDFDATKGTTTVSIPAWSPGYYQLANYQKSISLVTASEGGVDLKPKSTGARSWQIDLTKPGKVHLTYEVQADDPGLGFFGSHLDSFTGFINGASAFMYVDGRKTEKSTVQIQAPEGWDQSCPLPKSGSSLYTASTGYDELIDSPIQIGQFIKDSFTVEGIPFDVVYVTGGGPLKCNKAEIDKMLQTVSAPAIKMFGSAPFTHYIYYLHLKVGSFAGGLEHRNSTVICLADSPDLSFDDIAAHENFHAWNVKQIRPVSLGPFDYSKQVDTSQIWFSEGVTDYYADMLTYRSGLQDSKWLLSEISDRAADLQTEMARHRLTLAECGARTWSDNGFGDEGLSFYTKGYLVGWLLDAGIRGQTNGKKSLDDVMRLMFGKYRLPNAGFKAGDILAAVDEVIGRPFAMDSVYRRMVHSTEEMPYAMARSLGLEVIGPDFPMIGFGFQSVDGKVHDPGAQALAQGVMEGDKIVSITTYPWNGGDSSNANFYTLAVERTVDGKTQNKSFRLPFRYQHSDDVKVILDPTAGPTAKARLSEWLQRPSS